MRIFFGVLILVLLYAGGWAFSFCPLCGHGQEFLRFMLVFIALWLSITVGIHLIVSGMEPKK